MRDATLDIVDLRKIKPPEELSPPGRRLLRPLLFPLSRLYGAGVRLWRALPAHGAHVGAPVVSIGSLAVGGTGKTPLCMLIAGRFKDLGYRVCILSRGYRRRSGPSPLVVSDGKAVRVGVQEAGDEAYMMARRLKGVAVVVGKNRLGSAREVKDTFGTDLFVLDDGFQVRNLARNADILCFDEAMLGSGGALLPLGRLREGWSAVRPDHLAVVRLKSAESRPPKAELGAFGSTRVFFCVRRTPNLVDSDFMAVAPGKIEGYVFALVSGLACPAAFERSCAGLGAPVRVSVRYQDHHRYGSADVDTIRKIMDTYGADRILTTEKDFWKLPAGLREIALILTGGLDFLNGDEFWRVLDDRLRIGA